MRPEISGGREDMRKIKRWRYYCEYCNKRGPHMKGQSTHRMTRIPNLRSRMIAKNAGIADLAHVAGVSKNTVEFARQDRPIHLGLAACIVIALETRTYTKQKPGPKGPWSWKR